MSGQPLAFAIVFGLLIWKAGPAIKAALTARPARIKEALDTAAAARSTAEKSFADVKAALADSDKEAARILEEARETASKVGADIVVEASRLEKPEPLLKTEWIEPGALVVPYGTMSAVELSLTDIMRTTADGRGYVSVLAADELMQNQKVDRRHRDESRES